VNNAFFPKNLLISDLTLFFFVKKGSQFKIKEAENLIELHELGTFVNNFALYKCEDMLTQQNSGTILSAFFIDHNTNYILIKLTKKLSLYNESDLIMFLETYDLYA
jgi:hypothetical protein